MGNCLPDDEVPIDKGVILLHQLKILFILAEEEVVALAQFRPTEANGTFKFFFRLRELLLIKLKLNTEQ